MTIKQRAMVKTAMTIGIIAIILTISSVWPPLLGYTLAALISAGVIWFIYMVFYMIENDRRGS